MMEKADPLLVGQEFLELQKHRESTLILAHKMQHQSHIIGFFSEIIDFFHMPAPPLTSAKESPQSELRNVYNETISS